MYRMTYRVSSRNAFSLVELSIVLVILGLLVGGVLSGQALIRAAELRSVTGDFSRYRAAVNTFRDKYFAIPGDMTNATQFWGRMVASGPCVTNSGAAVNATTGVCDGNGDGNINQFGLTAGQNYETYQAWRMLALAGLIEGKYSGVFVAPNAMAPGINVPYTKADSGAEVDMLHVAFGDVNYNAAVYYNMDGGNTLGVGHGDYSGALTPEEAWNIDTKMDDGKPASGSMIAGNWSTCTTSANYSDFTGVYKFTATTRACILGIRNAF